MGAPNTVKNNVLHNAATVREQGLAGADVWIQGTVRSTAEWERTLQSPWMPKGAEASTHYGKTMIGEVANGTFGTIYILTADGLLVVTR
jgi:hypothetical protein